MNAESKSSVEITIGAVIRLKSGGLAMTVVEIRDGIARCRWFDPANVAQADVFPPAALMPVTGDTQ